MQSNINNVNAGVSENQQKTNMGVAGGMGNAVNSIGKKLPIIGSLFAEGGEVPPPMMHMAQIYHPHLCGGGMALEAGGKVPGKPKVDHDAYKNDTVTAKLTPGEVVIDIDTLKENVYSVYIEEADGVSRYDIVSNWRPGEICLPCHQSLPALQ